MENKQKKSPSNILTKREREVFETLVQDKTTKEIAEMLFISEKTVRNHISNVIYSDCELKTKLFIEVIMNIDFSIWMNRYIIDQYLKCMMNIFIFLLYFLKGLLNIINRKRRILILL